jgi:hypothetical protein
MQKGDHARGKSPSPEQTATAGTCEVKLDQHIGHQVTVTGTASHETKAEEKKEGQVENASSKEGFWQSELFRVKMVSETCTN